MFDFSKKRTHKRIYLDYASATPVLLEAQQAVETAWKLQGNPGSIHAEGVEAMNALKSARATIASELACKPREIVFVSGGTEANNLAILGTARSIAQRRRLWDAKKGDNHDMCNGCVLRGTHWIVSAIEHPSVLECFSEIERLGGTVAFVDPDERGIIRAESVARALQPETVFVSVGWGNGEIGTVAPLSKISQAIRAHEAAHGSTIIFHTDAGQAPLYLAAQPHALGVDLMSLDGAKLYGPRGVGVLFVGNRAELAPLMFGGKQERGLRAGTENVALTAGFAESFTQAARMRGEESKRIGALREKLARERLAQITGTVGNR